MKSNVFRVCKPLEIIGLYSADYGFDDYSSASSELIYTKFAPSSQHHIPSGALVEVNSMSSSDFGNRNEATVKYHGTLTRVFYETGALIAVDDGTFHEEPQYVEKCRKGKLHKICSDGAFQLRAKGQTLGWIKGGDIVMLLDIVPWGTNLLHELIPARGLMYKVIFGENIGMIGDHSWIILEPLLNEEQCK